MLAVRRFGTGPPLVALHGFTLTGEQFAPAAAHLKRCVIAPDLPGHGGSEKVATTWSDVISAVDPVMASVGESVPLLGYSQGGRIAMAYALDHPASVSALILVSANAGIDEPDERSARAGADARLATKLLAMTIDTFIEEWTSSGITATSGLSTTDAAADRNIRRANTTDGLARALVGYGQGAQPPMWDQIHTLDMPVLVMTGAHDTRYTEIVTRLEQEIGSASRIVIDAAGHNPLLDTPARAYGAISRFLNGIR